MIKLTKNRLKQITNALVCTCPDHPCPQSDTWFNCAPLSNRKDGQQRWSECEKAANGVMLVHRLPIRASPNFYFTPVLICALSYNWPKAFVEKIFLRRDKCWKTVWILLLILASLSIYISPVPFFSSLHMFIMQLTTKMATFVGKIFYGGGGKAVNGVRIPVVRPTLNPWAEAAFGAESSRRRRLASPAFNWDLGESACDNKKASPAFNWGTTAWKLGPWESARDNKKVDKNLSPRKITNHTFITVESVTKEGKTVVLNVLTWTKADWLLNWESQCSPHSFWSQRKETVTTPFRLRIEYVKKKRKESQTLVRDFRKLLCFSSKE